MHWSRVKTILIILFLFIDLFLLSYILITSKKTEVISESTVSDTISILNRNNINISASIIPRNVETMGVVELDNIWVDDESLAKFLFKSENIISRQENIFISDTKRVEFIEKTFTYTSYDPNGILSEYSTLDSAVNLLSNIGINVQQEMVDIKENSITFTQSIDYKPIFETNLTTHFSSNGIVSLNGYWIISNKQNSMTKKKTSPLLPVTGILVEFIDNPYSNRDGESIVSITTGYSIGSIYRDTSHKLVSIIPAYKLTTSSDDYYVYDARSGEFSYGLKNGILVYPK